MADFHGMSMAQQEALVALLRLLADAELLLEEHRCRLCEPAAFDPRALFRSLQGAVGWSGQRGWFNAHDVREWLLTYSGPTASYGSPSVEELVSVLQQQGAGGGSGEVKLEDFFRLVLPKSPANETLKRLALGRAGSNEASPEVVRRFGQLLEAEVESQRRLKFHRKALRDLGVSQDGVIRFLDSEQGPCAGMGGLLSPAGVSALLSDRLQALSRSQSDALLRRANVSGASFFSFEELSKHLWPPMAPISALLPSGVSGSPGPKSPMATSRYMVDGTTRLSLDSSMNQSSIHRSSAEPLGYSSPPAPAWLVDASGIGQSMVASPGRNAGASAAAAAYSASMAQAIAAASAPRMRDVGGTSALPGSKLPGMARARSPLPGLRREASPLRASPGTPRAIGSSFDAGRGRSPSPQRRLASSPFLERGGTAGLGASFEFRSPGASLGGSMGATNGYGFSSPTPAWVAVGASAASPSFSPPPPARSSSLPPAGRTSSILAMSPHAPSSAKPSWREEVKERLMKVVLQTMARQAELDVELEEAKALFPPGCLESAFACLDRSRRGHAALADVRALSEDFGSGMSVADFAGLVREVRLRWSWDDPAASALLIHERLSLRDLGLLLCQAGSQESIAVREAKTDDDARSALYILRFTEPCPRCTARVQRDADAAGCPTVTCPVCRTSFRCFCVVGDSSGDFAVAPLPTASRYQLSRFMGFAVKAAAELEQDRKKLSLLLTYDGYSLSDVFGYFVGAQATLHLADLRRTFFQHGPPLSERALGLLWRRYAPWKAGDSSALEGVSLPDFRRQLHPSGSW
mmetsp:Transcript_159270/g.511001  ORF Transcript_159270/g.511001 Transcript_159270/m.511001 type:complete len:808 (-) Transcript_159270:227-2650(-)